MPTPKELETELAALHKQIAQERELTEQTTAQWQTATDALRSIVADKDTQLAAFQKAAQEREAALKAACPPPESGLSLNVSFTGKVINSGQVTFRTPNVQDWRTAFDEFAAMVKERDWHFAPAPEKPPERSRSEPVKTNGEKTIAPVATQLQAQTQTTHTFPAGTLSATITDGKTYWKVKGGRFGKWGVTIWPEILDAAGFDALDPGTPYNLSGWTAEYVEKDGKPDKVVRLYK